MDFIKHFQHWFAEHLTMFLLFILPAIIIFWLFDKQIIPIIFKSAEKRKKIRHRFYQFKVVFWAIAIGVYIVFQANDRFFSTIIIMSFIGVVGYFFLNNYLTGIFIRFEGKLKVGQTIQIGDIQGTIQEFLKTKLRVMDKSQNLFDIPYSRFERETISQPNDQNFESLDELIFPIRKENYPKSEVEVRVFLEKSPWILQNQGIQIEYADDFMHIHFKLLEKEAKKKIKEDIKVILSTDQLSMLS